MKWIDKIKELDSSDLSRLLCYDFDHSAVCNVCWYYRNGECPDMCEVGVKMFLDSEFDEKMHNGEF